MIVQLVEEPRRALNEGGSQMKDESRLQSEHQYIQRLENFVKAARAQFKDQQNMANVSDR